MPRAKPVRWYFIPVRVLLVTFLLTLLGFALSLLSGILWLVIKAHADGLTPDMTIAYRHVALPAAVVIAAITLLVTSILEIRNYRQSRVLAQIAHASR